MISQRKIEYKLEKKSVLSYYYLKISYFQVFERERDLLRDS